MKKLFFLIHLTAAVILYSSISDAHDHGWRGHGHGHHHHHDHYYPQPQVNYYYSEPQVHYHPQPQINYYQLPPQVHYHPQPRPEYHPQQPRYSGYDQRSHQGLAGGVIGSVFGYEIGSGDPIAAGLGAAAGSYLGNGMAGRW